LEISTDFPTLNDAPTQDRSVQLFLDYYRLPSFQCLTCGWLKTYHDLVFTVTQFDPGLRDLYQSKQEAIFSQHVKRLADKALGLFTASFEEPLENVIAWQDEERNQSSWSQADEDLFFQHTWSVFALGNYHPQRTSRGARVPYVQKNGLQFGFLELDPDTFPVSCPPAQYWPRMGLSITPRWVGEMVGASDVPVSTEQDPRFPQAHSVEQTLEQADKLLNAACDDSDELFPPVRLCNLSLASFTRLRFMKCATKSVLWRALTPESFLCFTSNTKKESGNSGGLAGLLLTEKRHNPTVR
jgi:hypothetical protein